MMAVTTRFAGPFLFSLFFIFRPVLSFLFPFSFLVSRPRIAFSAFAHPRSRPSPPSSSLNSSRWSPRVRSRKYKRQRRVMEMDETRGKNGRSGNSGKSNGWRVESTRRRGWGTTTIRCFQGLKAFRSAGLSLFTFAALISGADGNMPAGSRRNR